MDELEKLAGWQIGRLVNTKQISAVEVLKYFADRIDRYDSKVNAFTYLKLDEALEDAKKIDDIVRTDGFAGDLAGVPIALKDFLPSKKGWPASHGGVKSYQTIDTEDSAFYTACKQLGCVAVGKTNAPAFGFRGTTDNKMYGPTSTPFKIGYNSGGSSGGSAAAVASYMVPLAECGDAGGSTRIPSAWCGCFGFKPSAGVVPSVCRPDAWTATHPYCCGGPAARNVKDAAIVLHYMVGYDPHDPLSVPVPVTHGIFKYASGYAKGMRVGYTTNFNLFPDPDREIEHAITDTLLKISSALYNVGRAEFEFHYSRDEIEDAWLRGISVDTSIDLELRKKNKGQDLLGEHADELCPEFIEWHTKAFQSTMLDYRKFHEIRTDILDAHLKAFEPYDIIVAPVTGCLPVKNSDDHDTKGPTSISGQPINPLIGFGYTYLENMNGFPAASVPIGLSKDGLPIGMQVIGKRYEDEKVLAFCSLIEELMPWNKYYDNLEL